MLQEGEIRAVGEERVRKVDVRVIAATHRDLEEEVRAGRFREDLFYRLNVVHLRVPPLRERPEDVPVLARHFLARFAERFGVPSLHAEDALLRRLAGQAWPGNVRELENAIERLVALSPAEGLDLALLPGGGAGGEGAARSRSRSACRRTSEGSSSRRCARRAGTGARRRAGSASRG